MYLLTGALTIGFLRDSRSSAATTGEIQRYRDDPEKKGRRPATLEAFRSAGHRRRESQGFQHHAVVVHRGRPRRQWRAIRTSIKAGTTPAGTAARRWGTLLSWFRRTAMDRLHLPDGAARSPHSDRVSVGEKVWLWLCRVPRALARAVSLLGRPVIERMTHRPSNAREERRLRSAGWRQPAPSGPRGRRDRGRRARRSASMRGRRRRAQ
jgi:hypothetical protein